MTHQGEGRIGVPILAMKGMIRKASGSAGRVWSQDGAAQRETRQRPNAAHPLNHQLIEQNSDIDQPCKLIKEFK